MPMWGNIESGTCLLECGTKGDVLFIAYIGELCEIP